ncbi:MAG: MOSC domain-containing protein [Acidobacteria bacterium]|nr:MOSC domain-containing protein [Acidobacteriota bacterium]MBI3425740.1 MOSC domain-containing protein [Acidobacteriota bacterium]
MKLLSLQLGKPRTYGDKDAADYYEKKWRTAIFRAPVAGSVWLSRTTLVGDQVANRRFHGGPDKAVNVYPSEHLAHWRVALQLDMQFGAFGENFSTAGLDESEVCISDVYRIGDAVLQVSQPRQPCAKLARRWRLKDFAAQVIAAGKTGWYLRVIQEGAVEAGMSIELVERPHPEWTIAAANDVIYRGRQDAAAMQVLAACPALSAAWRDELQKRLAELSRSSG